MLHAGFFAPHKITDTQVYERYGDAIVDGQVPYRDFGVEYPPAALPVFVVPELVGDDFRASFEGLMAGLGVGVVLLVGLAGPWWAPIFVGISPLLLGSVVLTRFDLWPVALAGAALALFLGGRSRLALGFLGVASAAKVYPALFAPILLAHVWKTRGRREALVCGGLFLGAVAAVVLPFALVSPGGVWDAFRTQAGRPLQIESLGAALLLAGHHVLGLDLTMESSHGSQNLTGGGADAIAALSSLLQAAAVVAVWIWYARGPAGRDRLLRACAAAVCAFIAFGKVLSPQFLLWLIPLVPLVRGRRGLLASGVLALALVLTQLWFPRRYWELALEFDGPASGILLLRDLTLIALLAVLTLRVPGERARSS
ncbi:MAG TPA: glycosyltransferase 87 family protein [Gaiellaceae bacterium]|nr:glycosyltransferase 87 family protein [Gaiellaceae bacterium]